MALTEEEQRLLAQLEASLAADDPKLAQTLGAHPARRIHGRRATFAGIGFVAGVALLIAGMQTVWVLSVLGFIVMFASTVIALGSWRQVSSIPAPKPPKKVDPDFMHRMEDRWKRRQGEGH